VLAADHRLRDSESFRRAVRAGRRAGSAALVVHLGSQQGTAHAPARVGVVVNRAVGNAVARNQVKRRLRHLLRAQLDRLPAGADLVVRAQPAAAGLTTPELSAQLDRCLQRVLTGPIERENL